MIRIYDGRTATWVNLWLEGYAVVESAGPCESGFRAHWRIVGLVDPIWRGAVHAQREDAEQELATLPTPLEGVACSSCGAHWCYAERFGCKHVCAACRAMQF